MVLLKAGVRRGEILELARRAATLDVAVDECSDAGGIIATVLETPQRAVSPGQSVVFYDGDVVVGGGVIARTPCE